jgi:hypothetical protein
MQHVRPSRAALSQGDVKPDVSLSLQITNRLDDTISMRRSYGMRIRTIQELSGSKIQKSGGPVIVVDVKRESQLRTPFQFDCVRVAPEQLEVIVLASFGTSLNHALERRGCNDGGACVIGPCRGLSTTRQEVVLTQVNKAAHAATLRIVVGSYRMLLVTSMYISYTRRRMLRMRLQGIQPISLFPNATSV